MNLSTAEEQVLEALSHFVVGGRLRDSISVREVASVAGIPTETVNGALARLSGRAWVLISAGVQWGPDDHLTLVGEGLARAASIAARRELTLHEVKVGEECFFISYDEPLPKSGQSPIWTAKAHRAGGSSGEVAAQATGATRSMARDAVYALLVAAEGAKSELPKPCDADP
jgi:hypothetical protein